uniref:B-cell receptor CD22 n=1 Tax=Hippocampus comes TaxID=109280 RepID=A0A3Q2YYS8_HIPCM
MLPCVDHLKGVLGGDWGVTFKDQCALEGTTVVVSCQYDYPFPHFVTSVRWVPGQWQFGRWVWDISTSVPPHFEYVGNYRGDCSLKINNIKHTDEGHYLFRFVTSLSRWMSKNALHLSVKDLTAVVEPNTVTEGQSVSLTCRSECGTPKHVWYRDGNVVPQPVFQASRKDSGKYYCAVAGQEKIKSASVALNVQYAPSNVVLSMTPPADIINGSSVTLSCRGDANPPVPPSGFSLYQGKQLISSGPSHTISLLQPSHSGLYHCQASNNVSVRGITFVKSTELNLDVQYLPSVADGNSVNVMCSGRANSANHSYVWYKWTSSSSLLQVGSGQLLFLSSMETPHTGIYLCQASSQLEVINSTKILLAMEEQPSYGHLSVPILGGLGACIFAILFVALLFLWKKQRKTEKKVQFPSEQVSSASTEDQSNSVYANVGKYMPSPQVPPRNYSKKQHANVMHLYGHVNTRRQRSHPQSNNSSSISNCDEVTYSTVTIQDKKSHFDENRSQESRLKMGQNADSVIYSTVANSS